MNLASNAMMTLNRECYCLPIEREKIDQTILSIEASSGMAHLLSERKNYFASTAVFLSQADIKAMLEQIRVIEKTINTPPFKAAVFARRQPDYVVQTRTWGAFMGYDFHITQDGPRLIEINSNAGGAFIVNALERSLSGAQTDVEKRIGAMFESEWALANRTDRLRTIAIVDEDPEAQFHYPDMCLARTGLQSLGYEVFIVDPRDLSYVDGALFCGETAIDLVYNRLTDFALEQPENADLKQALVADAVVVTPNPQHHALYADKRNLSWLSDADIMAEWGVVKPDMEILSRIPQTVLVTPENVDQLWAERKRYFFKPATGFGSRAAYRGAKLTRKTWQHITTHDYVAQTFVAPPLRAVTRDTEKTELKFDVRVYTYAGEPLLYAARVYQGQTTNLRTEGGGLAPVLVLDETNFGGNMTCQSGQSC